MDITTILTNEEKQQIISQKIKQWAADSYGHELNKKALLAADPEADTASSDEAIAIIQKAYESAASELTKVEAKITEKEAVVDKTPVVK